MHAFSTHSPLEGQGEEADGASLIVVDAVEEGRFDRLVQTMPEVRVALTESRSVVQSVNTEEGGVDGVAAAEVLSQLRETVRVLQTSYAVSMFLAIIVSVVIVILIFLGQPGGVSTRSKTARAAGGASGRAADRDRPPAEEAVELGHGAGDGLGQRGYVLWLIYFMMH